MSMIYDLDDIRLYLSIKGSRKFNRFRRLVGIGAMQYLAFLWSEVAAKRPDTGEVTGWDSFDIADICEYEGDPDVLYNALIECGWIDTQDDGTAVIHNWHTRQPHLQAKVERILKGRMFAAKRWGNHQEYERLYFRLYGVKPDPNERVPNRSPNRSPNRYPSTEESHTPEKASEVIKNLDFTDPQHNPHTSQKWVPNGLPNAPYPTLPKEESTTKLCKDCNTPFHPREAWHEKCDPCFKSNNPSHQDKNQSPQIKYKRCPYCGYTANYVNIDHSLKGCNACKPDLID